MPAGAVGMVAPLVGAYTVASIRARDSTVKTIRIAINRMATGKLPQGDPRWASFNDNFLNCERELVDLANDIYTGHAYTTWHQGRRSIENFLLAEHIAIDMDSGDERSSFDTLLKHDLVRMYGSLIHTTPSHANHAPRARVLFLLDEPITDAVGYQAAAKFLVSQFDGADEHCTDASRFFYGAFDCDIWLSENYLPVRQLRRFYRQWGKHHRPTPPPPHDEKIIRLDAYRSGERDESRQKLIDSLLEPLHGVREGNRNHTLNRQAFLAGKDIAAGKLSESEIVPLLLSAAKSVGLDEREAMRTIESGLRGSKRAAVRQ